MSIYKMIELVGTSYTSWHDAGKEVIDAARKTLEDLRVAEVTQLDMKVEEGKVLYRTKVKLSFKVRLEKFAEVLGAKPYAVEEEE